MKKDFKRLYTYGLIMIVCVIIIVIFAWLSSTKLESSQADYEDKLMQNIQQRAGIITNLFRDPLSQDIRYSIANITEMSVEKTEESKN